MWLQVRQHATRVRPGSSDKIKGVGVKSNGIMVKELQRQAREKVYPAVLTHHKHQQHFTTSV